MAATMRRSRRLEDSDGSPFQQVTDSAAESSVDLIAETILAVIEG